MKALHCNHTWELIKLLERKKALNNKRIYRVKNEYDDNKRYKIKFVVKGFEQKFDIDYSEIFSQVRCKEDISSWWFKIRNIYAYAKRIHSTKKRKFYL